MSNRLISHSEVESHGQCERKHYYAFTRRLQPKSSSIALQRGNAGHQMLENFLTGHDIMHDPKGKLAEIDMMPKMEAMALVTYWINNIWPTLSWKVHSVEQEFRVPIREGLIYPFKIDLIIEKGRKLYIVDHKFASDAYSDDVVNILPQIPRYMAGLRRVGINIEGGFYNFFRTRKLNNIPDKYVIKPVVVSETRRQESMKDLIAGMDAILENRPPIRTPNKMNCDHCGFYALCVAELNGQKTEFMERAQYEPNTYGYTEEVTENG